MFLPVSDPIEQPPSVCLHSGLCMLVAVAQKVQPSPESSEETDVGEKLAVSKRTGVPPMVQQASPVVSAASNTWLQT